MNLVIAELKRELERNNNVIQMNMDILRTKEEEIIDYRKYIINKNNYKKQLEDAIKKLENGD